MDDEAIIAFEFETVHQARIAVLAARKLWTLEPPKGREVEIWQDFQSHMGLYLAAFLTASARVSRLLWPHDRFAKMPERGPILRAIFRVPHDSPLRDRRLRNALEHNDEHIEAHYEVPREHRPFFGPGFGHGLGGNLNEPEPSKFEVRHGQQEYDVLPVYRALADLLGSYHGPVGSYVYRMWPEPFEKYYAAFVREDVSKTQGEKERDETSATAQKQVVPANADCERR